MAVISLTINATSRIGLADPTGQAVGAADTATFDNQGDVYLRVAWGGTGGNLTTITPATLGSSPALAVADDVVAFGISAVKWMGPYPTGLYNAADNKVTTDPDQACTITAFKLGSL